MMLHRVVVFVGVWVVVCSEVASVEFINESVLPLMMIISVGQGTK